MAAIRSVIDRERKKEKKLGCFVSRVMLLQCKKKPLLLSLKREFFSPQSLLSFITYGSIEPVEAFVPFSAHHSCCLVSIKERLGFCGSGSS